MLRLILKERRAQNTLEYALMIAVVVGALTAMQLYTRRGMQARLKAGVDQVPGLVLNIGELSNDTNTTKVSAIFSAAGNTQYEPYYYSKGKYDMTTTSSEGTETGNITQGGASGTRNLTGATTSRSGEQDVMGTASAD